MCNRKPQIKHEDYCTKLKEEIEQVEPMIINLKRAVYEK